MPANIDYDQNKSLYTQDNSTGFKKPIPINEEIKLNPKKFIMSKTDPKGIIKYCNNYFIKINGYEKDQLIGNSHNIIPNYAIGYHKLAPIIYNKDFP